MELFLGLMALAGVYLIYQFQEFYGKGIAMGVIAAILSSVFTVLNKRVAHKYPARTMVFYEMTAGWVFVSLVIGGLMVFRMEHLLATPGKGSTTLHFMPQGYDWLWLVILSLCCTVWAQSLALTALKRLSSFTATLTVNLEPVYGIILAFIFYKENARLNWGFYAGVGLILLSVALQMLRLLRPKASPGYVKERGGID
jgi:drug/metabolite transporter (DMT)-like permease